MNNKPFFSIAMPTYNRIGKLSVALLSILNQKFDNYEIVIVDNNSTDETSEIIRKLNNSKIKYYKNKKNIGVVKNVQEVIDHCKGEYIVFHSDDDFLIRDDALSMAYGLLSRKNYGILRLNTLHKTPDDKKIFCCSPQLKKDFFICPNSNAKTIIDFCEAIGTNFYTGIIIRNQFPKNIRILDSQIGFWFNHCFYILKKYGGYFMADYFFLCSWSMSVITDTYKITDGKIPSESYIENILNKLEYDKAGEELDKYLTLYLIKVFPAVKYFTNNANLKALAKRIIELSPAYRYSFTFWFYLFLGLISPKKLLHWYRFFRINNIKIDYKIKNLNKIKKYLSSLNYKTEQLGLSEQKTKTQLEKFLSFSFPK